MLEFPFSSSTNINQWLAIHCSLLKLINTLCSFCPCGDSCIFPSMPLAVGQINLSLFHLFVYFKNCIYLLCVCRHMCMPQYVGRGQGATCGRWFPSFHHHYANVKLKYNRILFQHLASLKLKKGKIRAVRWLIRYKCLPQNLMMAGSQGGQNRRSQATWEAITICMALSVFVAHLFTYTLHN